jgi:hypothetical protein
MRRRTRSASRPGGGRPGDDIVAAVCGGRGASSLRPPACRRYAAGHRGEVGRSAGVCALFPACQGFARTPPGGTGVSRLARTICDVQPTPGAAASSRRRTRRASRHCADSASPRCLGRVAPARRGGDRRRCAARRRGKAWARCVRARPSAGVPAVRGRASRGGGPLGGGVRTFPCMSGVCAHTPWRRRQPTTRDTPSVTTLCRESFTSRSPAGGVRAFPCMSGVCARTPWRDRGEPTCADDL